MIKSPVTAKSKTNTAGTFRDTANNTTSLSCSVNIGKVYIQSNDFYILVMSVNQRCLSLTHLYTVL